MKTRPVKVPPYDLVVLDLDGTLLDSGGKVPLSSLYAVIRARRNGVRFTIATGRSYEAAARFVHMLDTELPVIATFGAEVVDPRTGKHLWRRPVDGTVAWGAWLEATVRGIPLMAYFNHEIYLTQVPVEPWASAGIWPDLKERIRVGEPPARYWDAPGALQLVVLGREGVEDLYRLNERTGLLGVLNAVEFSSPGGATSRIHLLHPDVDKGVALEAVCEWLGICRNRVLVAGNDEADLAMFRVAGRSLVMNTAPAWLRALGDVTVPADKHAGLAQALNEELFGRALPL